MHASSCLSRLTWLARRRKRLREPLALRLSSLRGQQPGAQSRVSLPPGLAPACPGPRRSLPVARTLQASAMFVGSIHPWCWLVGALLASSDVVDIKVSRAAKPVKAPHKIGRVSRGRRDPRAFSYVQHNDPPWARLPVSPRFVDIQQSHRSISDPVSDHRHSRAARR